MVTASFAAHAGADSRYIGQWENVANAQDTFTIAVDGNKFCLIASDGKPGAGVSLDLKSGKLELMPGVTFTHVEESDTLKAEIFPRESAQYRRRPLGQGAESSAQASGCVADEDPATTDRAAMEPYERMKMDWKEDPAEFKSSLEAMERMNSSVMEQIEKLPPDNSERSGLQNTMDGVIKFSRCMRAV
ncbi:MAG: hypothetical protein LBE59_01605, partial [Nevskiaceae bacterium]|nr:hypothetical protein [Nevskiaceae bacterium]